MNNPEHFVDVKSILEAHSNSELALDNPLRHKHLVDLVLQSLTQTKSTSQQDPNLDVKISIFEDFQQQMSKIDWTALADELQHSKPKPDDLEELNDVIARTTRAVSTHDLLAVEKNTLTFRYMLHNLGYCLHRRFLLTGDQKSNEDAVSYIQRAVSLTDESDPVKLADRLADLASALSARFEYAKRLEDLEDAVAALRRSVALIPTGDASRRPLDNRLGEVLWRRFEVTGSTRDLEGAIQAQIAGSPSVGQ